MNPLTVVCAKCKHDEFHLVAKAVDKSGRGDVEISCVRCGSHDFAGLDPAEEVELQGKYVYSQQRLM